MQEHLLEFINKSPENSENKFCSYKNNSSIMIYDARLAIIALTVLTTLSNNFIYNT